MRKCVKWSRTQMLLISNTNILKNEMKRLIRIICLVVVAIGLSSCAILYPSDVYERDGLYHHTHSVIYRQPYYYHHHHHTPPPPKHHHKPSHPPKDHHYGKPSKPAPKPHHPSTPPRRPSNGSSRPTPHRR